MYQLASAFDRMLGVHASANDLAIGQIILRAIFVFFVWLVIAPRGQAPAG